MGGRGLKFMFDPVRLIAPHLKMRILTTDRVRSVRPHSEYPKHLWRIMHRRLGTHFVCKLLRSLGQLFVGPDRAEETGTAQSFLNKIHGQKFNPTDIRNLFNHGWVVWGHDRLDHCLERNNRSHPGRCRGSVETMLQMRLWGPVKLDLGSRVMYHVTSDRRSAASASIFEVTLQPSWDVHLSYVESVSGYAELWESMDLAVDLSIFVVARLKTGRLVIVDKKLLMGCRAGERDYSSEVRIE